MEFKKHVLAVVMACVLLMAYKIGFAQRENDGESKYQKVFAPQTHDLGNHTFSPINLNTGQPSIDIPIYKVQHHAFDIPISLYYDAGGFIPNKAPSMVGLNWSLMAGGMISRTVNNIPDEMMDPDGPGFALEGFFISEHVYNNDTVEYLGDGMLGYIRPTDSVKQYILPYELAPDLFVFNFAGHSGRFMKGQDGEFKVQADGVYKVDMGDLEKIQENTALTNYKGKISLTDENGNRYEFGGSLASVEYSYTKVDGGLTTYVPNAWYLTKVTSPQGHEIKFIYANDITGPEPKLKGSDSHFTEIPLKDRTMVVKNVYLRTIECRGVDGTLTQSISFHNSLRSASFSHFVNEKLDSIVVRDGNNVRRHGYSFAYDDGSPRLILSSFGERGLPPYEFSYWNKSSTDVETNTNKTDYWGFYNDKTKPPGQPTVAYDEHLQMTSTFPEYEADPYFSKAGVLTLIKNPLGGSSEYTYEGHDYYGFYGLHDIIGWRLYDQSPGTAGGIRLMQTVISDGNGNTQTRQYKYVRNYSPGTSGLVSSGILARKPNLFRGGMLPIPDLFSMGEQHVTYSEVAELFPGRGYTIHKFTASEYPDKTYLETDPKMPYYAFIKNLGSSPWYSDYAIINFYKKRSSLALERGRPLLITHFNSSGVPVSSIAYAYDADPARYNDRIARVDFPTIGITQATLNAQIGPLITTSNTYFFNTKAIRTDETLYDANGAAAQVTTTHYAYNGNRQVSRKTMVNSKGEEEIEKYSYVGDYVFTVSASHPLKDMQGLHILSPLVERQWLQKVSGVTRVLKGELTDYAKWNSRNLYRPARIRQLELLAPSTDTTWSSIVSNAVHAHPAYASRPEVVFDSYTDDGKVQQLRQKDMLPAITYLWSYAGQHLVAEIRNATYAQAESAVWPLDLTTLRKSLNPDLGSLSTGLRSGLPEAMVSTYTYAPLVGMTSETDTKGENKSYEYDYFGRLKAIKDHDGNIEKVYDYHYKQ